MKNCKLPFLVLSLLLTSFSAFALVEVRGHFGAGNGSPDDYNKAYHSFQDGPKLDQQKYLGWDAIVKAPLFPIGVGLRYETLGEERSEFAEKAELDASRFSLVLNYRFIDTLIYAGVLGTYGLSHDLTLNIPTDPNKITSESAKSYSLGIEGGVKLGFFRLGAEVGQMFMTFDDLEDSTGVRPSNNSVSIKEIDLSGTYYKIMVGVGF
ncbi:MAG: hypothetical protein ACLGHN_10940 [Bacteriovoracia bacterium]